MLLLKASIAVGIAVAVVLAVSRLVDGVDAFLIGSVVAGVCYAAGTVLRPGSNTSVMGAPRNPRADE